MHIHFQIQNVTLCVPVSDQLYFVIDPDLDSTSFFSTVMLMINCCFEVFFRLPNLPERKNTQESLYYYWYYMHFFLLLVTWAAKKSDLIREDENVASVMWRNKKKCVC